MNEEKIMIEAQELVHKAYLCGYKDSEEKKLEAYEEVKQKLIEQGRNAAWQAARNLVSMSYEECNEVLGETIVTNDEIFVRCTASEAIEKIKAYEKKQEEINVGDEVILNGYYSPAIIIMNNGSNRYPYNVMFAEGDTLLIDRDKIDRKTGRTFPQIAEVLKNMKEGE